MLTLHLEDQWNSNIHQFSLEFIKKESSKIEGINDVPVKHFAVDFSHIIINRKLE